VSKEVIETIDAFGLRIGRGHAVVYAGKDHRRRLTLNYGVIDDVEPHKVRVMRFERNGLGGADTKVRKVWVDREKVARVPDLLTELRKQEDADCCPDVYYCPRSGEAECLRHGGFDVCCDAPELHVWRDSGESVSSR